MNPNEAFAAANREVFTTIIGKTTGREFLIRKMTYGVLVNDPSHPLSVVSLSNSSMSIDLWTGCKWQCKYCHVQGTMQDLVNDGKMAIKPQRRNHFSVNEIIDELIKHPYFIPNRTIISIGTASTEPFAPGPVTESTFEIMQAFVDRGLKNPFWIVTKGGVPKGRKIDFARITKISSGVMVSLCWADNPETIEPFRNNRFLNAEEAKEAGAKISWYLRPIVPEWNGTVDNIEMMLMWARKHYGNIIDMIIPGGLRWTQGIENGLVEIHRQPMPNIPRDDNQKALPDKLVKAIFSMCAEYFPGTPVYLKSSCGLTRMLEVSSVTSVQAFARNECEMSYCPFAQRQICASGCIFRMKAQDVQNILDRLGIPAKVMKWDTLNGLITDPPMDSFTYTIRQAVYKHMAIGGLL